MKNNQTTTTMTSSNIVNLHHRPKIKDKHIKKQQQQKEIVKHVVSINNTQYNMSIEYENKSRKIVKEFSLGFSLKEMHINDNKQKKQLKTSVNDLGAFSVFFNFINYRKLDLTSLEDIKSNKVALYKNYKTYFYGNRKTDTTKVSIRVSKVAAIFLLVTNLYNQITENDNMLTTLKNNKKQYKFDKNIDDAIKVCIEKKSELKKTFIEAIKNMLKRYF